MKYRFVLFACLILLSFITAVTFTTPRARPSLNAIRQDINGDGRVDKYDAMILMAAYASMPASVNWNAKADLNSDNRVDIYDALLFAANYGNSVRAIFGATGIDGWHSPVSSMTNGHASVIKAMKLDYFQMYHFSIWNASEPNKGIYDFSCLESNVNVCLNYGLKVFDTMPEFRYRPDWATRPEINATRTVDEMVPVTRELARHFKGKILGWTLGRELNLYRKTATWLTNDILYHYFRELSEAIRAEDPAALTMIDSGGDSSINLYNWFKGIIDAGIDFDIISPHPYFATANYAAGLGWDPTPETIIKWSFGGTAGNRVVDLPKTIWCTEIGFFPNEATRNHTAEEEISVMTEAITIFQRDYPQITGFFWFPWKTSFDSKEAVRMWGLVDAGGTINPVGQQWQKYASN